MKTTRTTLATGLLAALAVALPATASSALPIAGATVRSTALGSAPSVSGGKLGGVLTPITRTITGFSVTTDSVVATAVLNYSGTPASVTVRWGDNAESTRNLVSPLPPITNGQTPQDPPGTVTFKHLYNLPVGGGAFAAAVVGLAGTDTDTRAVIVTPRFRVTQFQAFFAPRDHCDSFAEEYSEWRIQQALNINGANGPAKTWRQDRKTANGLSGAQLGNGPLDAALEVLDGSATTIELTMADQHPTIIYNVTELDPVFDDDAGTRRIDLHPSLGSRHVQLDFNDDSSCKAVIAADVDVALLKPGLNNNSAPVAATA